MSTKLALILATSFNYLPYRCIYCWSMIPILYLFQTMNIQKAVSSNTNTCSVIWDIKCLFTQFQFEHEQTKVCYNRIMTNSNLVSILAFSFSTATQWHYFFFLHLQRVSVSCFSLHSSNQARNFLILC